MRLRSRARAGTRSNCPEKPGPDHDFGQSPILLTLPGGKRVLVAGQKSGEVHAFDPDGQGQKLWTKSIGRGGALGGIEWGSASDGSLMFVPLSDVTFKDPSSLGRGGLDSKSAAGCLRCGSPTDQSPGPARAERVRRQAVVQSRACPRRPPSCPARCSPDRWTATSAHSRRRRESVVGLRHGERLHNRERRRCPRRVDRCWRPGDRQRRRGDDLGLWTVGWHARERAAGVFSGWKVMPGRRALPSFRRHARCCTAISPPFNSTLRLAIVSPSPVPVVLVEK